MRLNLESSKNMYQKLEPMAETGTYCTAKAKNCGRGDLQGQEAAWSGAPFSSLQPPSLLTGTASLRATGKAEMWL